MHKAVGRDSGQSSDLKEEGKGMVRNILRDLMYLTGKKDRGTDTLAGVMSLVKWVEYVTINWDRKCKEKNEYFSKE